MTDTVDYDPRYLRGIVLFNRGDFFEAHEVWEDLWHDTRRPGPTVLPGFDSGGGRPLYHAGNGNARGARRLFHSGRRYMAAYPTRHLGLDVAGLLGGPGGAPLAELLPDPAPAGGRACGGAVCRPSPSTPGTTTWPAATSRAGDRPAGREAAMNDDLCAPCRTSTAWRGCSRCRTWCCSPTSSSRCTSSSRATGR